MQWTEGTVEGVSEEKLERFSKINELKRYGHFYNFKKLRFV